MRGTNRSLLMGIAVLLLGVVSVSPLASTQSDSSKSSGGLPMFYQPVSRFYFLGGQWEVRTALYDSVTQALHWDTCTLQATVPEETVTGMLPMHMTGTLFGDTYSADVSMFYDGGTQKFTWVWADVGTVAPGVYSGSFADGQVVVVKDGWLACVVRVSDQLVDGVIRLELSSSHQGTRAIVCGYSHDRETIDSVTIDVDFLQGNQKYSKMLFTPAHE